ncbi:hypothetical protein GCM10009304_07020 [Pseudomonas matsuisoli]|uniref:Cytochrome c oxidase assembly protein n=2 Tax=Pseudomonas matsuisoli TaxID=1515666 RepID=A0A917PLQ6_9PSED|nr:hypothetical protein GCM10009304_07020 [Pseudomonas matsuisoli]
MRMTLALLVLLTHSSAAHAHGLFDGHLIERVPVIASAILLALAWGLYVLGAKKVRPHGWEPFWMHLAMLLAVFSAFGPLDEWAESSTAWHMVQHMLFMIVVAPLWALARPLPQWRAVCGDVLQPLWRAILRSGRYPVAVAMVHGALIWIWHTPSLYLLALDNLWWHMLEHACFLFSAWLFWWACLRSPRALMPQALMAQLLTLMHTGLLGALLTFSRQSFYGSDRVLESQQIAGLLMWVPGSVVYLAGCSWIIWRWLKLK